MKNIKLHEIPLTTSLLSELTAIPPEQIHKLNNNDLINAKKGVGKKRYDNHDLLKVMVYTEIKNCLEVSNRPAIKITNLVFASEEKGISLLGEITKKSLSDIQLAVQQKIGYNNVYKRIYSTTIASEVTGIKTKTIINYLNNGLIKGKKNGNNSWRLSRFDIVVLLIADLSVRERNMTYREASEKIEELYKKKGLKEEDLVELLQETN
jgi:DNA-binding transcriptional MerR regulator